MRKIALESFINRISSIARVDTSADPKGWKPNNPLWGHCAIVALLVQKVYGGEILRASLMHIPTLMHIRSHYANRLPSGVLLDVTAPQFGQEYPYQMTFVPSSSEHILAHQATKERYEIFRKRYITRLSY